MLGKPKKCPLQENGRHRWKFIKNFSSGRITRTTSTFSLKGSYRCECGATKDGVSQ